MCKHKKVTSYCKLLLFLDIIISPRPPGGTRQGKLPPNLAPKKLGTLRGHTRAISVRPEHNPKQPGSRGAMASD